MQGLFTGGLAWMQTDSTVTQVVPIPMADRSQPAYGQRHDQQQSVRVRFLDPRMPRFAISVSQQ